MKKSKLKQANTQKMNVLFIFNTIDSVVRKKNYAYNVLIITLHEPIRIWSWYHDQLLFF